MQKTAGEIKIAVESVLDKWDEEIKEMEGRNQLPNPATLLTYIRSDIEKVFV